MRRRRDPGHIVFQPSAEAQQWLHDDLPEAVKQVLRMAAKGGRLPKGCLVCHRPGQHREVWLPDAARGVLPSGVKARLYVLCDRHVGLPDDEVARRLYPGARPQDTARTPTKQEVTR
jgi:hypothetical protein